MKQTREEISHGIESAIIELMESPSVKAYLNLVEVRKVLEKEAEKKC